VTIYTFILREVQGNENDHPNKDYRRGNAISFIYELNLGITILDSPQNMLINGVWHYWWFLEFPDNNPTNTAADMLKTIITQFTVTNKAVELAINPTQPL
jgi:hypothetical protein